MRCLQTRRNAPKLVLYHVMIKMTDLPKFESFLANQHAYSHSASPFSGDFCKSRLFCRKHTHKVCVTLHAAQYHQTVTDSANCTKLNYGMLSIRRVAHLNCTSLICRNCVSAHIYCLRLTFQIHAVSYKVSRSRNWHCGHFSHNRQGLYSF